MKNSILNHLSGFSPAAYLAASLLIFTYTCSLQSCSVTDPISIEDCLETGLLVTNLLDDPRMTKASLNEAKIRSLDVFVFNDDAQGRLDSYMHFKDMPTAYLKISSSAGDKLVALIANMNSGMLKAEEIMTYSQLENIRWNLKDEDPAYPIMSGESQFCAGEDGYTPILLTPIMSNVTLDFVRVNFSGRGYKSKTLENASVYLTNVSASAEILRQSGFRLNDMVNAGRLDQSFLRSMKHPEILYSSFIPEQWKPVNLYCYPNDAAEGILGSEHTRMVVQGDIDGSTYYYPIEINQEGFGYSSGPHGLSRDIKYSYSLTITRKGSSSPDEPIGPEDTVQSGWIELHPGQFITGHDGEDIHIWCDMYPEYAELDICKDDLDYDADRGIYTYRMDEDGHGVTLSLSGNGTGMFTIDAGEPINQGFLVIVVVNP